MIEPLPPGHAIGILGGGQLGRMLAVAAARLGFVVHIYEPAAAPPAGDVAQRVWTAPYDDRAALAAFGDAVDVITYEFENVPTTVFDTIGDRTPIRPGARALAVSQDRLKEKQFLNAIGCKTAPFAAVDSVADLRAAAAALGLPAILKTRRFGYDGKGQVRLTDGDDIAAAIDAIAAAPAILEGLIDFEREISVIVARTHDGATAVFEPGENVHRDGILRTTTLPAAISPALRAEAEAMAAKITAELDYIGVLGVELFATSEGLLVNEFAPRVHNSGHWTQDGAATDQFEQHIRAIAGWPLGPTDRLTPIVMENLIGDEVDRWRELASDPRARLHLYGKRETRPGRKMGHVNLCG